MNYEQLEIFFGSPGVVDLYPVVSSVWTPATDDYQETVSLPDATVRQQWEAVFAVARRMNKYFHTIGVQHVYKHIALRTGILTPTSYEGKQYYGAVVLASIDLTRPIGPGSIELHSRGRNKWALVRHWTHLPVGVPLPGLEARVPAPLLTAWFKDKQGVKIITPQSSVEWEDLL